MAFITSGSGPRCSCRRVCFHRHSLDQPRNHDGSTSAAASAGSRIQIRQLFKRAALQGRFVTKQRVGGGQAGCCVYPPAAAFSRKRQRVARDFAAFVVYGVKVCNAGSNEPCCISYMGQRYHRRLPHRHRKSGCCMRVSVPVC